MKAKKDENILEYINKMKTLVEEINTMRSPFHIDDLTFTDILTQSLPTTWDQFLDAFAEHELMDGDDPKEITIVQFICKIKNEYYCKKNGGNETAILLVQSQSSNIAMTNKKSLTKRIANTGDTAPFCKNCKKKGHATDDCRGWRSYTHRSMGEIQRQLD